MATPAYLHGVEVVEATTGPRPVAPSGATFIGIVGTSLDGPPGVVRTTLGAREAAELWGDEGTIAAAIAAIHSQGRAPAIAAVNALDPDTHVTAVADEVTAWGPAGTVVRLAHARVSEVSVKQKGGTAVVAADYEIDAEAGTLTVAVGATFVTDAADAAKVTYKYLDISLVTAADVAAAAPLLCEAEEASGRTPDILIAPGFSSTVTRSAGQVIESAPVASALAAVADRCRAIVFADALAYRATQGSRRVMAVDPAVKVLAAGGGTETRPLSGYAAGLTARIDAEVGWWASPSNRELRGIAGASRFVSFGLGDANSEANLLNASQVTTVIRSNGWRLWGNRTCSNDPKWQFLSVVRIADKINEQILRSHMWAVDRNITATYVEDVVENVNAYLRDLKRDGAILGGRCWADPDLNPVSSLAKGRLYLDFDFTPAAPAERITFRSRVVDDYAETVI
ncbi:MAG: phage tail sheath subtilisin-like domain-containing protein [Bryobacterales bacterium]|nr:phage tail sheath subtilisin-like domain-containing protein [Bryobacterales bacterium]